MWLFFVNSVLLGVGLSMDAFSVSIANGLAEPQMRRFKSVMIAATYSVFQFVMPLVGWFLVTTLLAWFHAFEPFIPYIALGLLLFIGVKMIVECLRDKEEEARRLTAPVLLLQGVATSIDALSVGFTIAEFAFPSALCASLIIGAVTFAVCCAGLWIGRRFGGIFRRAEVIGGVILILIGIEIFVKNVFFA